jgi:hypothetical protein
VNGTNDSIILLITPNRRRNIVSCKRKRNRLPRQYRTCDGRPTISSLRHRPPLAGGRRHDRRRRSTLPRRDELNAAAGSWWSAGAGGGARPWRSPREHGGWPAGGRDGNVARFGGSGRPTGTTCVSIYTDGQAWTRLARSMCTDVRANVSGQGRVQFRSRKPPS